MSTTEGPLDIDVDRIRCDGFGMCAELLPEMIDLDDWGYPILRPGPVPPDLLTLMLPQRGQVCLVCDRCHVSSFSGLSLPNESCREHLPQFLELRREASLLEVDAVAGKHEAGDATCHSPATIVPYQRRRG